MMKRVAASLVVLLMLPTIAAAPSSPRGTLEDFLGDATAILREATDPQQAWSTVQGFAARLFDGRLAARRTSAPAGRRVRRYLAGRGTDAVHERRMATPARP
jgi:hypothetical protein